MRILSAITLCLALLAPGHARAFDPSDVGRELAPTWAEFRAELDGLEELLGQGNAVATALFRVHNRYGVERKALDKRPDCEKEWVLDLAARARVLGHALRNAVQSLRVRAAKVRRRLAAPTVRPLLDAAASFRAKALLARVDSLDSMYREAASWHVAIIEPVAKHCDLYLSPAEGFAPSSAADSLDDVQWLGKESGAVETLTAVVNVGHGMVCPGEMRGRGVVLIRGGRACYGETSCGCEPVPVLPAAILGPRVFQGSTK